MAHPKRKISVQRKNKRRNSYSLRQKNFFICPITGKPYLPHVIYFDDEGNGYYNRNLVLDKSGEKK